MELVDTIIKEDNEFRKEEERIYRTKDNLGLKSYLEIKNKFFNKRLDDVIIDEINELGCCSHIALHYRIVFYEEKKDFPLFTNVAEINDREEVDYNFYEDPIDEDEKNGYIELYGNKFYLEFVMKIRYYKSSPLDDIHIEDDEEDDEDVEIPPVALSYPSEFCVICYTEKPNILNFPCLHISQCEACNEKGKFIKCIICKDEIQYKIKI